jgi:plastocyanin
LTRIVLALSCIVLLSGARVPAGQDARVSGTVTIERKDAKTADNGDIAVWLTPTAGGVSRGLESNARRPHPKIEQHHKQFDPRFLVIPVGTTVDFPNLDPFFHNVFSLFDGKRFDLGLYEAGTSRSVPFTRPGVCYVFCNIHPEMSAVIVVVDTRYYGVTNRVGEFSIPDVPPGRYTVSAWSDRARSERAADASREIVVSAPVTAVEPLHLIEADGIDAAHKNKYGKDYVPPTNPIYTGRRGGGAP